MRFLYAFPWSAEGGFFYISSFMQSKNAMNSRKGGCASVLKSYKLTGSDRQICATLGTEL